MQEGYPDTAPHDITVPIAAQRWEVVSMLHWRVPTAAVEAHLPAGVRADTIDGSAWASLTPLRMADVRTPPLPPVPGLSTFPETNVRTYAVGPAGPAIWFCSLDIPRLLGVPFPRLIGQPYAWSRMRIEADGEEVRYTSRRRLPAPRGASSDVGVRVGNRRVLDDLDRWVLNRWGAYSIVAGRLVYTPVAHTPWVVHDAEATVAVEELSAAAGLGISTAERAHHAPLVDDVTFGFPKPV